MDISVILDGYKFNYRVACIIQNKDKILLHKNKEDIFYALPGGRVKIGENSISALKREFMEEIGQKIYVKDFLGLVENFFEYNGKKYHEILLIFKATFDENSRLYDEEKIIGLEENGNLEFVWKKKCEIKDLDIRPKCLKENIDNISKTFHVINNME